MRPLPPHVPAAAFGQDCSDDPDWSEVPFENGDDEESDSADTVPHAGQAVSTATAASASRGESPGAEEPETPELLRRWAEALAPLLGALRISELHGCPREKSPSLVCIATTVDGAWPQLSHLPGRHGTRALSAWEVFHAAACSPPVVFSTAFGLSMHQRACGADVPAVAGVPCSSEACPAWFLWLQRDGRQKDLCYKGTVSSVMGSE